MISNSKNGDIYIFCSSGLMRISANGTLLAIQTGMSSFESSLALDIERSQAYLFNTLIWEGSQLVALDLINLTILWSVFFPTTSSIH